MNLYFPGSALNLSALYMIAGCGAALSIKSGELNLGGEGQIYAGGLVSALLLAHLPLPPVIKLFAAMGAAFLISALLTLISAFLKITRKADFLFTTFITSAAIIPVIDGLIAGPARGHTGNLLATPFIPENTRLPSIMPPSPLNASFIFSLILCIVLFYIIYRTSWGRKVQILGISPSFAEYSGFSHNKLVYSSAIISGGLHGLCGATAVLGTYFTCHSGFYSGMGWNSFSAALIAGANPLLLIPSSLFMGFITTYSNKFALYNNFGFDISSLIQAVILFVISFPLIRRRK